jgi:hypothetical protein
MLSYDKQMSLSHKKFYNIGFGGIVIKCLRGNPTQASKTKTFFFQMKTLTIVSPIQFCFGAMSYNFFVVYYTLS